SEVRDRGFHEARARRGQYQDVVLRADELLHVGENTREQRAELGGAMVRAVGRHRYLGLRQQRRRSGSEEPVLLEHENQNIRKPVVRETKGQKLDVRLQKLEHSL